MDHLQKLLDKATDHGSLSPIGAGPIKMRTSLYADDATLFIRPTVQDITNVQQILAAFGEASGLYTNLQKSAMYMIQPQAEWTRRNSQRTSVVSWERSQLNILGYRCILAAQGEQMSRFWWTRSELVSQDGRAAF
jgi:hypothetical protein